MIWGVFAARNVSVANEMFSRNDRIDFIEEALRLARKAAGARGDTYYAVIEFSNPVQAEALLGYGNWSKAHDISNPL